MARAGRAAVVAADRGLTPDREASAQPDSLMPTCWSVVMPALRQAQHLATPARADDALLHVLQAYIETLKAENEILKRRLRAAEARGAKGRRCDRRD